MLLLLQVFFFFFQAEDGIRDIGVTGVQTCALPISSIQSAKLIELFEGCRLGFSSLVCYRDRAQWIEERIPPPAARAEETQISFLEALRSFELLHNGGSRRSVRHAPTPGFPTRRMLSG